jgi:hypothetical protein
MPINEDSSKSFLFYWQVSFSYSCLVLIDEHGTIVVSVRENNTRAAFSPERIYRL